MPPKLALVVYGILVLAAFRSDRKSKVAATRDLLWPTLWYLTAASRPLGVWLIIWGIPIPGGSGDPTEGSLVDRYFLLALTVIGIWILHRRGFEWRTTFRRNPWLTALLAFMLASVLWSQYPYVSFKRYVKVIGSVVMALVVLSDERPFEAVLTVLRRCLYIHLPMSIVCIKYFRYIGVSFDWFGVSESWMGIATSKNTLGQVAMLGMVYFAWEVWRHWRKPGQRWVHFVYLAMAAYLLKGSEDTISLTSISVAIFALTVFYGLYYVRSSLPAIRRFTLTVFAATSGLILFVVIHSIVLFSRDSLFGQLIAFFGRDVTLTDRTSIWSDVYAVASGSPLLGVGFGGFWIGRLANIPWSTHFTWVLGQAHSGYIDTYLQLGLVGVVLLAGVILTSLPRLLAAAQDNFDFACFRITLFMTVLFVNVTETTFLRGDHHLWLVFLLAVWSVTEPARASNPAQLPIAARYESHGSTRL